MPNFFFIKRIRSLFSGTPFQGGEFTVQEPCYLHLLNDVLTAVLPFVGIPRLSNRRSTAICRKSIN